MEGTTGVSICQSLKTFSSDKYQKGLEGILYILSWLFADYVTYEERKGEEGRREDNMGEELIPVAADGQAGLPHREDDGGSCRKKEGEKERRKDIIFWLELK